MSLFRSKKAQEQQLDKKKDGDTDSLGDLAQVMGSDYGHGVAADAPDPNAKPVVTVAPVVSDITQSTCEVSWEPLGQAVSKVVVQAAIVSKKREPAAEAFKNFEKNAKSGSVSETLKSSAATASKTVLTGLTRASLYYVRLVATNPAGAVESEASVIFSTLDANDKPLKEDKKAAEKAAKEAAKAEAEAKKAAAKAEKEAAAAAAAAAKKAEKEAKATLKRGAKPPKDEPAAAAAAAPALAAAAGSTGSSTVLPVDKKEAEKKMEAQATSLKSITSRLGSKVISDTSAESTKMKMFEAVPQEKRSKIYDALNPQKLYYESRRDKEEAKEDKVIINVRGGMLGSSISGGAADYGYARDDFGNIQEHEEETYEIEHDEDDYDPNHLPDFGDLQPVMDAKRAERAKKEEERRAKLREEYLANKKAEDDRLAKEVAEIRAKEALMKKAELITDQDVAKVQKRLEQEVQFDFKFQANVEVFGFG